MGKLYMATTGPAPTTLATTVVTSGTGGTMKSYLQIKTGTAPIRICEWGVSFDGTVVDVPLKCELIDTGTVAATVTSYKTGDIYKYNDPNAANASVSFNTSNASSTAFSGYNATAEGAITSGRVLDVAFVSPTGFYVHQFPLGREPEIKDGGSIVRVRVTSNVTTSVNAYAYCIWEE